MPTELEITPMSERYGEKVLKAIEKKFNTEPQDAFDILCECETLISGIVCNLTLNEKQQAISYADLLTSLVRELKQRV